MPHSDTDTSSTSRISQTESTDATTEYGEVGSNYSTASLGMVATRGDLALRDEVETLRREVERMRQRDALSISEALPSYSHYAY